jgi:RecB family exonuclease
VETTDFVTPHPTPIAEISPSLANQLMACPLRVAFSRDPERRSWNRPSTYSVLGLAAHAVTEEAFKQKEWLDGDTSSIRSELEKLWERKIARGADSLNKAWAPAIPPPPQEWPGYALTRTRTIRRATKLLAASRPDRTKPKGGIGIEIELRDEASELFGRADRIERDGGSTRIVDLKTGLHQDVPTEDQRRQLLMYAILVHRSTGEWPNSVAVEDASGIQYIMPLDPADAESALSEVEAAKTSFNKSVETGDFISNADPTSDRCRWCAFRVLCHPFWKELASDWGQRAACGTVEEVGTSDGGAYVAFTVESPVEMAGRVVHVSSLPKSLPVTATKVAIVDWAGASESGAVRARWSTTIREW